MKRPRSLRLLDSTWQALARAAEHENAELAARGLPPRMGPATLATAILEEWEREQEARRAGSTPTG